MLRRQLHVLGTTQQTAQDSHTAPSPAFVWHNAIQKQRSVCLHLRALPGVFNAVVFVAQAHAAAAASILSKRQQLQQELSELTASVRNRLQLRRLYKDDIVSAADYKSACNRLLQHREHLLRCNIEGLSIRVSDKNRVSPDGSLVDIAWDFEP
jgi:hypothetical protein